MRDSKRRIVPFQLLNFRLRKTLRINSSAKLLQVSSSYKYGCDGWDFDEKTQNEAKSILRTRYPRNPWTAKPVETEEVNR